MVKRDPRIDAYIEKAQPFARPILKHLRAVVHKSCPDVVETLEWSHPSFEYEGMLCGLASFKQHCAFGFWKHELVVDAHDKKSREAMGSFGCLKSVDDLPSSAELTRYIKKARKLNEDGVKVVRAKTTKNKKPVTMPPVLTAALAKHKKAKATFDAFTPSHRKEYMEWIGEAKGEDTRARRVAQAIEWLAQGKSRNWKYAKC